MRVDLEHKDPVWGGPTILFVDEDRVVGAGLLPCFIGLLDVTFLLELVPVTVLGDKDPFRGPP